jgi:head-tail adaptor
MIGLSASELSQMRSAISDLLPDTCSILELTRTSDGAGGWTESWGTVTGGSAIPCRVDYKTGKEQTAAGAITPYQSATISMGYAQTITSQNRVLVGSNTFSVQAINTGQSWIAVTRVAAELIP